MKIKWIILIRHIVQKINLVYFTIITINVAVSDILWLTCFLGLLHMFLLHSFFHSGKLMRGGRKNAAWMKLVLIDLVRGMMQLIEIRLLVNLIWLRLWKMAHLERLALKMTSLAQVIGCLTSWVATIVLQCQSFGLQLNQLRENIQRKTFIRLELAWIFRVNCLF